MDGSTPQHERQPKVINFNTSSAFLFLTSTPAGGVGLNLTGANKVVLWDPSWSPAMDLQAMDRAFRLGQMRDVSVYRLIAAGTIEEMQYLRQISKQQHTNMVVEGDEGERRTFNAVKPRKGALGGEHGELWGFYNLFKLEAEKVQSVALLGSQVGDESASAGGGTGGGTSAGAGRGQPFKVELIDPEVMAMLEKEEEAAGGPAEPRSDDGDGLGDFLGDDGDVALLRAVGAAGMLRHEKALGPKKREAAAAREVVEVVKGEMNCPEGAALAPLAPQSTKPPQSRLAAGPAATMLECLAAWLHLPVAEAACQLLEMSEPERTKLRKRYAEHAPTGAFRPKEK